MSDDVKIPISLPGAKAAGGDLKAVADGLRNVGNAAKGAGTATTEATGKMSADAQSAGENIQASARSWDAWKVAGMAAATAVAAAMRRVISNMQEHADRIRQDYQSFVGLSQQNDTRALAQIRGQSEAKTTAWMTKQSAEYGIAPEEVRGAAFEIESGFQPEDVGGAGALASMEKMAFQTMRATGAGGKTVAGLQIAAYESGLAKTPKQFGAFLAKSAAYAGASRMTLQDFGGIMSRLLPMAVKVGIDPDEFQSMAAAMSFRISDPGRLATSLEQLIRAAGTKSGALDKFAASQGRDAASMSASEVMSFQSGRISDAMAGSGPQGAMMAAEELGIAPELAQVYGVAFDPAVQNRMGSLQARAAGATFGSTIGSRFTQSIDTPEGRTSRAGYQQKYQAQRRAIGQEQYQADLAGAKAGRLQMEADRGGNFADRVAEAVFTEDQLARQSLQQSYEGQLQSVMDYNADPRLRARAESLLGSIRTRTYSQITMGVGQNDAMADVGEFLSGIRDGSGAGQTYHGGTHYHNGSKADPAGKPRTPAVGR